MFMRKKCFFLIPLCLVLILGLFFCGATLYLRVEYNYQVESLADCWTNFWNQPDCYYAEQGIEYTQVDNGLIFRFDRALVDNVPMYIFSCGRSTPLGRAYALDWDIKWYWVGLCVDGRFISTWDSLAPNASVEGALWCAQYNEKCLLSFFSDGIPTDNSGAEPWVSPGEQFTLVGDILLLHRTILFPEALTDNYILEYQGAQISGSEIQEYLEKAQPVIDP